MDDAMKGVIVVQSVLTLDPRRNSVPARSIKAMFERHVGPRVLPQLTYRLDSGRLGR